MSIGNMDIAKKSPANCVGLGLTSNMQFGRALACSQLLPNRRCTHRALLRRDPELRAYHGQPAPYPSLAVRGRNGRVADKPPRTQRAPRFQLNERIGLWVLK